MITRKLNIENVSRHLGVSKPTVYSYLDYLERAGLLSGVMPEGSGSKLVRKPAQGNSQGHSKKKHKITGKENAYIVKDDIDIGFGNVIPLWLFGFLY